MKASILAGAKTEHEKNQSVKRTRFTNKYYFEFYAMYLLNFYYNKSLKLSHNLGYGSPDWFDRSFSLGLEVTRVFGDEDPDYLSFVSQYFSHMDDFLKLKKEEQDYFLDLFNLVVVNGFFIQNLKNVILILKTIQ